MVNEFSGVSRLTAFRQKLLHPCDKHMGVAFFPFLVLAIQTTSPSGQARWGRNDVYNKEVAGRLDTRRPGMADVQINNRQSSTII